MLIDVIAIASSIALSNSPVLQDVQRLSADDMSGRETATVGAEKARNFIASRFSQLALNDFENGYQLPFNYQQGWSEKQAVNVAAWRQGCIYPQQYVVITAHYDHLGQQGRKIFHGADDNASGVAAMLELAARLANNCPAYSYIFLATDAEESGLYGSKAFVANPPVALSSIVFNLNLDMVSRADRRGRLYVTGARRFPSLKDSLKQHTALKVQYLSDSGPGRLSRDSQRYDWSNASDHGPFHRAGVPYIFIGGQEHNQYHTPEDQWQRIEPEFLDKAMQVIWYTVQWLEQQTPAELTKRQ